MIFLKKYTKSEIHDIKKIGVIMFGLLGDVLLRTPVIRALHETYPDAQIIALVDPIGKEVLNDNPDVNEIIVFDRKKEKNKLKQNLKKIKSIVRVRQEKFDLLVNLYNAGLSRPMVLFSSAKYKLGFCMKENKFLYNVKHECVADRLKEAQSYYSFMISIIEPLSDKQHSLKPIFKLQSNTVKKMQTYIDSFNFNLSNIYVLNLAASKEDKIMDFEKSFFFVKYIYQQYGFIPAIVSNPGQEYLQKQFIDDFLMYSGIPYLKLDTLSLAEVAALIKLTKFIVTPDTGLMHLAMAFNNYILTIFTYTHPLFVDPKNEHFIAVYKHFDEGVLYQKQEISEEILQQNCDKLLIKLL